MAVGWSLSQAKCWIHPSCPVNGRSASRVRRNAVSSWRRSSGSSIPPPKSYRVWCPPGSLSFLPSAPWPFPQSDPSTSASTSLTTSQAAPGIRAPAKQSMVRVIPSPASVPPPALAAPSSKVAARARRAAGRRKARGRPDASCQGPARQPNLVQVARGTRRTGHEHSKRDPRAPRVRSRPPASGQSRRGRRRTHPGHPGSLH